MCINGTINDLFKAHRIIRKSEVRKILLVTLAFLDPKSGHL
jgi:hypothetical protein